MATVGLTKRYCRRPRRANFAPVVSFWTVMSVSRLLIVLGLILVVAGLLWPLLARLGLGRLPGDLVIRREGFTLYVPLVTSLLVSLALTLVLWLLRR